MDTLEQRQKQFFSNCRKQRPAERTEEFNRIRAEYERAIVDSSEKIGNAEDCYNLVDRYLRKLDQELHKFKLELEADNRGITEVLEKRSLELDAPQGTSKENRLPKKQVKKNLTISHSAVASPFAPSPGPLSMGSTLDQTPSSASRRSFVLDPSLAGGMDTTLFGGANLGSASPYAGAMASLPSTSNPLAAAASQAIAATQNMGGRRTSSLKASYEAINQGTTHEFTLGGAAGGAAGGIPVEGGTNKKQKK